MATFINQCYLYPKCHRKYYFNY